MTDRKQALADLLAKLEVGERPWREACYNDALGWSESKMLLRAFEGSLGAAKALHAAVLPGWTVNIDFWMGSNSSAKVMLDHGGDEGVSGLDECPARAWIIAQIKALIAMEGE